MVIRLLVIPITPTVPMIGRTMERIDLTGPGWQQISVQFAMKFDPVQFSKDVQLSAKMSHELFRSTILTSTIHLLNWKLVYVEKPIIHKPIIFLGCICATLIVAIVQLCRTIFKASEAKWKKTFVTERNEVMREKLFDLIELREKQKLKEFSNGDCSENLYISNSIVI